MLIHVSELCPCAVLSHIIPHDNVQSKYVRVFHCLFKTALSVACPGQHTRAQTSLVSVLQTTFVFYQLKKLKGCTNQTSLIFKNLLEIISLFRVFPGLIHSIHTFNHYDVG